MALGLPVNDGADRTPIIKYDARAGRLFRVDRTQSDGSWEANTVEITPVFQAIFDMENIELGWLYFPTNGAPEIEVAPYGQPIPPRPSKNHRPGYRVHLLLGKQSGGDVREMAANAQISVKGMDTLHDLYLAGLKTNPGLLPVVKLGRTEAVVSPGKDASGKAISSTNYRPIWEIVKWTARPPELSHIPGSDPAQRQQALGLTSQAEPEPVAVASVEDDF